MTDTKVDKYIKSVKNMQLNGRFSKYAIIFVLLSKVVVLC